jgi:ubiquinone biosynthesis protein COQ9
LKQDLRSHVSSMTKHKTRRAEPEMPDLDDRAFDVALVGAAFDMAEASGWERVSVAGAARLAGLKLDRARARFPGRGAVLLRFGSLADQAALVAVGSDMAPREVLFDLLMARFDVLQQHRGGVLALLRALVLRPGASLLLAAATRDSMRWMLEAAGVPVGGVVGRLRVDGLTAAWFYVLRAWTRDESADLTATMAALDRALSRAMQAEALVGRGDDGLEGVIDVDDDPLPPGMVQDLPALPEVPPADLPEG